MEALRVRKSSFKKDKLRSSVFDTDAGGATTKEGYLSKKSHGLMSKWQKRYETSEAFVDHECSLLQVFPIRGALFKIL